MPGWETVIAALGGLVLGASVAVLVGGQRARAELRRRLELETRLRRDVLPVLERRAAVLGIPPRDRGDDGDGTLALVATLGRAIKHHEESQDLPFGDTLQAAREQLEEKGA
ncbi:MAG: hypothetical protein KF729_14085 [Sandaracinaceae bacterium]|nr:hypothetical protein [Sandaracinaceae bacterium]